ncbi:MAG: hypothetical protein ACI802_000736, partial [Candidatus Paceibacteria bacterium]
SLPLRAPSRIPLSCSCSLRSDWECKRAGFIAEGQGWGLWSAYKTSHQRMRRNNAKSAVPVGIPETRFGCDRLGTRIVGSACQRAFRPVRYQSEHRQVSSSTLGMLIRCVTDAADDRCQRPRIRLWQIDTDGQRGTEIILKIGSSRGLVVGAHGVKRTCLQSVLPTPVMTATTHHR